MATPTISELLPLLVLHLFFNRIVQLYHGHSPNLLWSKGSLVNDHGNSPLQHVQAEAGRLLGAQPGAGPQGQVSS